MKKVKYRITTYETNGGNKTYRLDKKSFGMWCSMELDTLGKHVLYTSRERALARLNEDYNNTHKSTTVEFITKP